MKSQESAVTNGAIGADGVHVLVSEEQEGNVHKRRRIDEVGRLLVDGTDSMVWSFD